MSKRFYQFSYKNTDTPILFEDAGQLLKISGILLQGMGSNVLCLLPAANRMETEQYMKLDGTPAYRTTMDVVYLSTEELSEIIRITDDPKIFEQDDYGDVKAIHRKVRAAISGAVQQKIWVRDGLTCLYCGRKIGHVPLSIDHFMPLELSGANDQTNYITSCRQDNKQKGNMHPSDWCNHKGLNFSEFNKYLALEDKDKIGFAFSHLIA